MIVGGDTKSIATSEWQLGNNTLNSWWHIVSAVLYVLYVCVRLSSPLHIMLFRFFTSPFLFHLNTSSSTFLIDILDVSFDTLESKTSIYRKMDYNAPLNDFF